MCYLSLSPAYGLWLDLMEISFNTADVNNKWKVYFFLLLLFRYADHKFASSHMNVIYHLFIQSPLKRTAAETGIF